MPGEAVRAVTLPWRGSEAARHLFLAAQLGLLVLVIHEFRIESQAFLYLFILVFFGFGVHSLLPVAHRMAFFLALSLVGVGVVLGPMTGLWVIGLGLLLIGICHMPVAFGLRVALLITVAVALVAFRSQLLPTPWSAAIWPILGSMFMFRLIVYLYDLRHEGPKSTLTSTLSYFFLLPNVVFPLFPVVDYRTFRRTYYDDETHRIYQTGLHWILRGVIHLILYRFVYYYLTVSPDQVQTAGDLVTFLLTNYLLYLRISGHFHIAVGILHLFGFNLPETNHLYYLASSFTDYWRRINIYWKDFMMKVFYYPSYFASRRLGNTTAIVLSTGVVFVATMLLHSYQWYWIRGAFPIAPQDIIFWSVLAVLVAVNAVWESRRGKRRSLSGSVMPPGRLPGVALRTLATFSVICVLWSLWTARSVTEWLSLWSVVRLDRLGADVGRLSGALLVLGAVVATAPGGVTQRPAGARSKPGHIRWLRSLGRPSSRVTGCYILLLFMLGNPLVYTRFGVGATDLIRSLQQRRLSDGDQALLERGYYESLLGVERFNMELWSRYAKQPADWVNLWQTDAVRWTGDLLRLELKPNISLSYKGTTLTTNRWGMRDRDYALERAPNTFRIALLGSSPIMGSGVGDLETVDTFLEEHLSRAPLAPSTRYEVLNFGTDGYTALQQMMVLERKVLPFQPDAVLYVAHETEAEKTIGQLATLLEEETPIPYPDLQALAALADVEPGTMRSVGQRRLRGHAEQILQWSYQSLATLARENGIAAVWVYMPMPTPGTGEPCLQRRASLCFGSTARPGGVATSRDARVARLFRLAEAAGFVTIDLSGAYDGHQLTSLWVSEWDTHPNATGLRLVADHLYQRLADGDPGLRLGLRPGLRSATHRSEGG